MVKEGQKEGVPVAGAAAVEGVLPPAAAGPAAAATIRSESSMVTKEKRKGEGGQKVEPSERVVVMDDRSTGVPEDRGAGADI